MPMTVQKISDSLLFDKIFLSIFLFSFSISFAQPFDAIINLGGDCQSSYQLYIHGLRKYALPFDALITPYASLREILLHTFDGFMVPENFELTITEKGEKYILDKKYGSQWIHDFKLQDDFLKDYVAIAEKYVRRIDRFLHLITVSEYPLFIRKIITKEQAVDLRNILFELREGRPFLLVAVDGTQEMENDWQIEGIRNYYLRQPVPYVWKGDSNAWEEIFCAVGLELSDSQASTAEH